MALKDLFGKKKKTEEKVEDKKVETKTATKKAPAKKAVKTKTTKAKSIEAAPVVKETTDANATVKSKFSYRITEKATKLSDKNVFVLNVPKEVNKTELKKDLEKNYKVTVLEINIVNSPKKAKFYRGRFGVRGGGKKAYVTVKAGDSIVL
jgi:large subunit ribosomal protein L23